MQNISNARAAKIVTITESQDSIENKIGDYYQDLIWKSVAIPMDSRRRMLSLVGYSDSELNSLSDKEALAAIQKSMAEEEKAILAKPLEEQIALLREHEPEDLDGLLKILLEEMRTSVKHPTVADFSPGL